MECEKESIGGGLMRCRRCKMDWFEHQSPPIICIENQSQGTPYRHVLDVPDYGLMRVED